VSSPGKQTREAGGCKSAAKAASPSGRLARSARHLWLSRRRHNHHGRILLQKPLQMQQTGAIEIQSIVVP
jgi:hypothetical protein